MPRRGLLRRANSIAARSTCRDLGLSRLLSGGISCNLRARLESWRRRCVHDLVKKRRRRLLNVGPSPVSKGTQCKARDHANQGQAGKGEQPSRRRLWPEPRRPVGGRGNFRRRHPIDSSPRGQACGWGQLGRKESEGILSRLRFDQGLLRKPVLNHDQGIRGLHNSPAERILDGHRRDDPCRQACRRH